MESSFEWIECLKFYRARCMKPINIDLIGSLPDLPRSSKLRMSNYGTTIATSMRLDRGKEQVLVVKKH